MSIGAELRERAYVLWRDNQRNLKRVEALLKEEDSPVTRITLAKWRDEFGWEARATQAEAQEKLLKEGTTIERLLTDLIARKTQYDNYFKTLAENTDPERPGKPDNQATYAYAGLLKRIAEMQAMQSAVVGFDRPKFFLENLQWIIGWMKGNDPEGLKVLARNIDAMALQFKAECMNGNA